MNRSQSNRLMSVEELRQDFDRAFAAPVQPPPADLERFLPIVSGTQRLALRITDLARIEPRRKTVPLPGSDRNLLGLAGIQGRLVPVYSLAGLLNVAPPAANWQWIAVCAARGALGLAVDDVLSHFSAAQADKRELGDETSTRQHLRRAVFWEGELLPVVEMSSVQDAIVPAIAGASGRQQETKP